MIVAFVGTYDDDSRLPIRGNGKTNAMTGYAYLDYSEGKHIWSNYYTNFSEKVIGLQEMINIINNEPQEKTILVISEIQKLLNSIGSNTQEILFIDNFVSQLRKLNITLYYDTQRFLNIQKRLRIHTDVILIPHKHHFDNAACNNDLCKKPHKIFIYSAKPFISKYIKCFDATLVGNKYNTNEYIEDTLIVPKKRVQ